MVGRNRNIEALNPSDRETEDNTEALARQEVTRLTRQLHLMENDKRAYLEESNSAINRQKKVIEVLTLENQQIQLDLDRMTQSNVKEKDEENLKIIMSKVEQCKMIEGELKKAQKDLGDLGKDVNLVDERLEDLKVELESRDQEDVSSIEIENKIFVLKKKLETVTSQFDAIVAENVESRKTLNKIIQENASIMKRYGVLEGQVGRIKTQIDGLVEEAMNAYDQREEAVAKANALTERNIKERKQYKMEMSELSRVIRHEEKLLDFMNKKNTERLFLETDEERSSRLEQAKEQIQDQAVESYRENFEKLLTEKSATISRLIDEYTELHHSNVRKFAYINELNNEIEMIQNDVVQLRDEIKSCSKETIERNEAKNNAIIIKQNELDGIKKEFEELSSQLKVMEASMKKIIEVMEALLKVTNDNGTVPVLELLGNQQGISVENSILFLNILGKRVSEAFGSRSDSRLEESGRGSPSISPRSPLPNKSSSIPGSRGPKIVVTESIYDKWDSSKSEDEIQLDLLESEQSPLGYTAMRDKISMEGSGSSISGDDSASISSNIFFN